MTLLQSEELEDVINAHNKAHQCAPPARHTRHPPPAASARRGGARGAGTS